MLPQHRTKVFDECGISEDVANAACLYSIDDATTLTELGFAPDLPLPALAIPYFDALGNQVHTQIRPDQPEDPKRKYLFPRKAQMALYLPPVADAHDWVNDPDVPLVITEGALKALSAVSHGIPTLAVPSVWCWKGRNGFGGTAPLPDFDYIAWASTDRKLHRLVIICFDSDIVTKPGVHEAMERLGALLERKGAAVQYAYLPHREDGLKCGLDDYLVDGGTFNDLMTCIQDTVADEPVALDRYKQNNKGIATRFAELYGDSFCHVTERRAWMYYSAGKWQKDNDKDGRTFAALDDMLDRADDEMRSRISEVAEQITALELDEDDEPPVALTKKMDSLIGVRKFIHAFEVTPARTTSVLRHASGRLGQHVEMFDQLPHLFNLANGTYDLDALEFTPHEPTHYLTVRSDTMYDDQAQCPAWKRFIESRWESDEMRRYVQKVAGTLLAGNAYEKAAYFFYGLTNSGKTTFCQTIVDVLGTAYAQKISKTLLLESRNTGQEAERRNAVLRNKRFVYVDETSEFDRLDTATVKDWSGGNTSLRGRDMYEEAIMFDVEFTLAIATNFFPRANGLDDAFWNRVRVIDFGERIPDGDIVGDMRGVFRRQSAGIFQWLLNGYRMYRAEGLTPPDEVLLSVNNYREQSDPVAKFISEHLPHNKGRMAFKDDVYQVYAKWCEDNGFDKPFTKINFGRQVSKRGVDGSGQETVEPRRRFYKDRELIDID